MKAIAVFPADRTVRLVEHEPPRLTRPTEVKLRMLDVGVCGTDREIAAFEYGVPPEGSDRLIVGHESLGVVIEAGSEVSRLRIGDLVVPMVRRPCRHETCVACRSGRQDFCYTGDFTERGIKGRHGFMTELVVDEERYMNPVPQALRDVAVLVEPLTIAEKALTQVWQVQQRLPWQCPGETNGGRGHCRRAVVLGAGPVGLLGAMALRVAGFEVFVYSRDRRPNAKATLVESIGAAYVSSETTSIDALGEMAGNIDLVYEAAGASKLSFDVLRVLGTNGVFVFTGVPGRKAPVPIDTDAIMRSLVLENQVVFGTVNAPRESFEAASRSRRLRRALAGRGALAHHRTLPARGPLRPAARQDLGHQERDRALLTVAGRPLEAQGPIGQARARWVGREFAGGRLPCRGEFLKYLKFHDGEVAE